MTNYGILSLTLLFFGSSHTKVVLLNSGRSNVQYGPFLGATKIPSVWTRNEVKTVPEPRASSAVDRSFDNIGEFPPLSLSKGEYGCGFRRRYNVDRVTVDGLSVGTERHTSHERQRHSNWICQN